MLIFKREVLQPLSAHTQQARKSHFSSALAYNVSVSFRIVHSFDDIAQGIKKQWMH